MTDDARSARPERYALGYGTGAHARMAQRRADDAAGFFLPHLRPGMRLLDVGCGPGSITVDLATLVAPGEVVGIDIEPRQVDRARALAAERGITNIRFEVGDAYAVPFADASFDTVFANTVLMWLPDPLAALKEFRRVLRSGGVAGIRDAVPPPTWGPATPLREEARVLIARVMEHRTGRPANALAYQQRRLLAEAGFARTEGYVEALSWGTPEAVRQEGASWATLLDEAYRPTVLASGWADAAKVDAMVAELRAWGEQPDAFGGALFCAAVGWVDA